MAHECHFSASLNENILERQPIYNTQSFLGKQLIDALATAGFKISLVSNGKYPFQERNFHAPGFRHLFDFVFVSEAVGLRKPDRAIFELACHGVVANIRSSVFIGNNSVTDLNGAKDAGMSTVYVPLDLNCGLSEYADATYGELSELAGYVAHQR